MSAPFAVRLSSMASTRDGKGPALSEDLLTRIMYLSLYHEEDFSPYRQTEDLTGAWMDVKTRRADFCRTFVTVSRSTNQLATRLLWKSIYVETARGLSRLLALLGDVNHAEKGTLCTRLETRIGDSYRPGDLAALLKKTPNLKVFILRNIPAVGVQVLRMRPIAIFEALSEYTTSLERVQLESPDEEPRAGEVQRLLASQKHLKTLHIDDITGWGFPDPWVSTKSSVESLEVLSMGNTKRGVGDAESRRRYDEVLHGILQGGMLPQLKEFHIENCASEVWKFLATHGKQIRHLGFSCTDFLCATGVNQHILNLCPSITRVTLYCPEGRRWENAYGLAHAPELESIQLVLVEARSRGEGGAEVVVKDVLETLTRWNASLGRVDIITRGRKEVFDGEPWYEELNEALRERGTRLRQTDECE